MGDVRPTGEVVGDVWPTGLVVRGVQLRSEVVGGVRRIPENKQKDPEVGREKVKGWSTSAKYGGIRDGIGR